MPLRRLPRRGSVYHPFEGDGERCIRVMPDGAECRRIASTHRRDTRKRKGNRHLSKKDRHKNRPPKRDQRFIFFDTEGKGSGSKHRLIYGAAVDEDGQVILEVNSPNGRSQPKPHVWLDALLEIGRRTKQRSVFAYGFGYDRTKMLEGLPAKTLYLLTRREERPLWCSGCQGQVDKDHVCTSGATRKPTVLPLYWGDFQLDLQGTRFSVARLRREADGRPKLNSKGRRMYWRMTVWDVIKFFQCAFVDALDAWRWKGELCRAAPENSESGLVVPDAGELGLDRMRHMKLRRADFDKEPWENVKRYCQSECLYGAKLVRELVTACTRIGVNLRRFDGAGSISDALMGNHEVGRFMLAKNDTSPLLLDSVKRRAFLHAVMCAFAGGRFESVYCGIQRGKVHVKDIASAYPYAMFLHACLACGTWEHFGDGRRAIRNPAFDARIEAADFALLKVRVHGRDKRQSLGSLHHRDAEGNITFPIDNLTWTWKHEYLAARDAMQDRCEVLEAYLYRTDCGHQPFSFMSKLYLERLRIGKEGRGIAMKLGYNGCAGKTMQRVGSARWQEYVWAGNTTSMTRAQLLYAIGRFPDQWDVCYLATDSVFALRDVDFPEPENTGTGDAMRLHGKPPLGGWERGKYVYDGMVFVRPGIAFPLHATDEQLKEIKARGVSKSVLLENVPAIVELMSSQKRLGEPGAKLELQRRLFAGMKMSTTKRGQGASATYHASELYGQWYEQAIGIKLSAAPKRFCRLPGEDGMLLPWPDKSGESLAYGSTKVSEEARMLRELQDALLEQPNLDEADFSDVVE